ncbi:hypothetical protein AB0N37_16015 [Streptomyces griseoincarnatus]
MPSTSRSGAGRCPAEAMIAAPIFAGPPGDGGASLTLRTVAAGVLS